jgi:hypothetical protein
MTSIFIDPYILAYPIQEENFSVNDFEDYIQNLLSWRELKDVNWSEIFVSKNTSEILMEFNDYPQWETLRDSLAKSGLNQIYQPKDIIGIIDGFLHLPSIEEKLGISDILFDDFVLNPNRHLDNRPSIYSDEHNRLLMLMMLSNHFAQVYDASYLVSRGIGHSRLDFSGNIIDCDFDNGDSIISFPLTLKGYCTSCVGLEEVILSVDPVTLWKESKSFGQYRSVLDIYIYQRLIMIGEEPSIGTKWSFGREFFNKCREQGFLHEESKIKILLKSCAEVILEENQSLTHALRTGEGGNNPQKTRGNDKAWRRDINYEYHLHYWQTNNGFELASVVVHNNMEIPA